MSYGYGSGPPPGSHAPYGFHPPHGSGGPPPGSHGPYGSHGGGGGLSHPPHGGGSYNAPPPSSNYGSGPGGLGSPFAALVASAFPPGTDPQIVSSFQMADQDGSGLIDDRELQRALSSYHQSFSMRTVHLLMYMFTHTNVRKIGPKEFTQLSYSLQSWRATFEKFDKDRSGRIDSSELREALLSIGFSVSQVVLELLIFKFDKTDGMSRSIEYDNFIECCITVKGLSEKFKERDTNLTGTATFSYDAFMLSVLPFLIA